MVAYVTQLLLAISATARELIFFMLSSVKSSLKKKAILHKVAIDIGVYTVNLRTSTIKCMLYKFLIYMVIPCIIFLVS